MLLDDALENGRVARAIPRAFGIDHRDRPAFANAQTVRLRSEDAALLGQPERLEALLEVVPGREPALFLAALRVGLIAAEEDVAAGDVDPYRPRDGPLGFL